ncbi:MAG: O-antigen ligase family protein [Patescibacteria group bacterium]
MKAKTGFFSSVPKIKLEDFIFLLILFLLPTQFGRHFWPDFSYISGVRIDYLSPTIYITDILILLLFISVFIKSFKNSILKVIKKNRTLVNHLILITLFIILNILFSKNILPSLYGAIKLSECIFFALYTFFKIRKIKQDLILFVFSSGVIFQSLLSIAQYIKQGSLGGMFYFLGERTFNGQTPGIANVSLNGELILRSYGTFSHPNVLAGFLLLIMTFILFNSDFKKIMSSLYICAIILGTVALLFTFSRIAILLWLFSILFFVFSKVRTSPKYKASLVALLTLSVITSFFLYSPFYLRFIQTSFFEDALILREKLIFAGFEQFLKNPILGVGLNNYFSAIVASGNVFILQPVHNIFLLTLIQTGVVGFCYFMWIFYKALAAVVKTKCIYLKLIFFYIILIGLFDHYFITLQQGQLLFSYFMGVILSKHD